MKYSKICGVLLGSALTLGTYGVQAQTVNRSAQALPNVSYNFVGVRYITQKLDEWDCNQDGLNVYGSMDIQDGWFARASLTDVSGNRCGSTSVSVGGGYHTRFNPRVDMYGTLSFESISPDGGGSDSGIILAAGMRGFFTRELEGGVELMHSTTFSGTTAISGGLAYWFNRNIAGTLDLGFSSDTTTLALGARLYF